MWTPNFKTSVLSDKIEFPVACELKIDGEFVYWNGTKLINKRGIKKTAVNKMPNVPAYGELYYGEGKEFYSEIHSHHTDHNVIFFDTDDIGKKPYMERRKDLDKLSFEEIDILPFRIAYNKIQLQECFEEAVDVGHEGIVIKPLNSLDDSSWLKLKRQYTATLLVRGLRKNKMIPMVAMGDKDHIYCHCSLNGWHMINEMLRAERIKKADKWVLKEDDDLFYLDSDIKLELKFDGITPNNMFRNARIKRVRAFECELTKIGGQNG